MVIFPDAQNNDFKEVLFLKETSAEIAIWEGAKLTKEQAFEVSGIKTVFWLSQFEMVFNKMMAEIMVGVLELLNPVENLVTQPKNGLRTVFFSGGKMWIGGFTVM